MIVDDFLFAFPSLSRLFLCLFVLDLESTLFHNYPAFIFEFNGQR